MITPLPAADHDIFSTVRRYIRAGMTREEAIEKAEGELRVSLPQSIKDKIKEFVK